MARPKAFDPEVAQSDAMQVFWRQGYSSTTTSDLAGAMGIGRQSFYDTFGDKRDCYIAALRLYVERDVAESLRVLRAPASPVAGVRRLLRAVGAKGRPVVGCMAVDAVSEHGTSDAEVSLIVSAAAAGLHDALMERVEAGKVAEELLASVNARRAADVLLAVRSGLLVSLKGGASAREIRSTADFAVDQLCQLDVKTLPRDIDV